jgi:hypothetical protein
MSSGSGGRTSGHADHSSNGSFGVEIEGCARCGGKLKILASIEEP